MNIKVKKLLLDKPQFANVSDECKDLITKMICKDPNLRLSANDALDHPCIKRCYQKSMGISRELFNALINLQNFECKCKLEEAVIDFIVNEFADQEDINCVQEPFTILDQGNKGYLTKSDILHGFQKIYGQDTIDKVEMTKSLVDQIFKKVDLDGSEEIEYQEWVMATINKDRLLNDKILQKAFNAIDDDHGGSISAEEFREALFNGKDLDPAEFSEIMDTAGLSEDTEIDFESFTRMMQNLLYAAQSIANNTAILKKKKRKSSRVNYSEYLYSK